METREISWPGGGLALPRRSDGRTWAGRSVVVQERLDGSLWVSHDGLCVLLGPAPADPAQLRARHLSRRTAGAPDLDPQTRTASPPPVPSPAWTPGPDHPWRGRYAERRK